MFAAWMWMLGLALLAGHGEAGSCIPGVQGIVPNVALGRPAFQSSTYKYTQDLSAPKAVDGNCNGNLDFVGSCTHTYYDVQPWWYVDLGEQYTILAVVVKNRGNCCGERLRGAEIHVGNYAAKDSISNALCGTITDTRVGSISTIHCNGLRGRYVSVNIPHRSEFLTLCEVEVYGLKGKDPCPDPQPCVVQPSGQKNGGQ